MAISERPVNLKTYYKSMKDTYTLKKEDAVEARENLIQLLNAEHDELLSNKDTYNDNFSIDLLKYSEFTENKYVDGKFFKVAKGAFLNRKENYTLVAELFDLYRYAKHQKELYELEKNITKYDKLANLSLKDYTEIMRVYMTEVHKKLILEGNGYVFGEGIGWICINRCVLHKPRPHIDYAATKKREAELKAEGKRIYNKEEAEWCAKNGIEYKAEDKRVFKTNEYCYEIPLISSKLPNGTKLKLEITDYRHANLRGKTNDDIIKICNNNTLNVCEQGLDMRTKLTICDKIDKILYTKFIRNENQQPITTPKANRKN